MQKSENRKWIYRLLWNGGMMMLLLYYRPQQIHIHQHAHTHGILPIRWTMARSCAHLHAPSVMGFVDDVAAFDTHVLHLGRADRIHVGDTVVDAHGLWGRVIHVGEKTSHVLLITAFSSRIPVLIGPQFIEAILVGNGTENLSLILKDPNASVQNGDMVVTSDIGSALERGIPVGVVIVGKMGIRVYPFSHLFEPKNFSSSKSVKVFLHNA